MKTRLLAILLVVLSLVLVLSACGKKDTTTPTAATTTEAPTTTTTPAPTTTTTVKTWTITFEGAEVDALTVVDGEAATAPVAPTRLGYEFAGWKSGTEAYNWANPVTADLTLTADWDLVNYTITYELNGGENHPENPATYTIDDEIVFQAPTKTGSEFAGWDVAKIEAGSTGDITVTATWTVAPLYKVDFEDLDNDVIHYLEKGEFAAPNGRTQTTTSSGGNGRADAGLFLNYSDALADFAVAVECIDIMKCAHNYPTIDVDANGNHYLAIKIDGDQVNPWQTFSASDDYCVFNRWYLNAKTMGALATADSVSVSFRYRMTGEGLYDLKVYARGTGNVSGQKQNRSTVLSIAADGSIYIGYDDVAAARVSYKDASDQWMNAKQTIATPALDEWHTVTIVFKLKTDDSGYNVTISVDGAVAAENLNMVTGHKFYDGTLNEILVFGHTKTCEADYEMTYMFDDFTVIELG